VRGEQKRHVVVRGRVPYDEDDARLRVESLDVLRGEIGPCVEREPVRPRLELAFRDEIFDAAVRVRRRRAYTLEALFPSPFPAPKGEGVELTRSRTTGTPWAGRPR
jgi:hypothetical protein